MWKASDFERLDPKLFRGFLAVMRTGSMSEAARMASLTQGAISQQIAKLEERLGTQLFVRTVEGISATTGARMLARFAEEYLASSSAFMELLNQEYESMQGLVRYAMPESCIHSPHFSMLLERRKEFAGIEIDIALEATEKVYRQLLAGEVDFGFVLDRRFESQIDLYPFCVEQYGLIAAPDAVLPALGNVADLYRVGMVWYPQAEHYLAHWCEATFGQAVPDLGRGDFQVRGSCSDLRGALSMVLGGLGVAVVPLHVAHTPLESGALCHVQPVAGAAASTCQIYIAMRRESKVPARVRRVIRWFLEMHADLQPVPERFLE